MKSVLCSIAAMLGAPFIRANSHAPLPVRPSTYDTAEKIRVMAPGAATVEFCGPCSVQLRTRDGRRFYIGGPGATPEVRQFLAVLQEGKTYHFPAAFFHHQKKQTRPVGDTLR